MALVSSGSDSSLGLIPPGSVGPVPSLSPNLRYEDLNASVGGIARGTGVGGGFTNVYDVSGQGLFFGFILTLESAFDDWSIGLTIDSNDILGSGGISTKDLEGSELYAYDKGSDDDLAHHLSFNIHNDTIRFEGPMAYPISYATDIQIKIKFNLAGTKLFKAGLALRTI